MKNTIQFLAASAMAALALCTSGCTPDSYTAEHQVMALPENKSARITAVDHESRIFIVVRLDGSVWRYCTGVFGNLRVKRRDQNVGLLESEDCLLEPLATPSNH